MTIVKDVLEGAEDLAIKLHKKPEGYKQADLNTLDEIADTITCGSVLLCSGTAAESRLIEEVDHTDFSHSAMIVRFHGDPKLYLWTADTVDKMEDQIHKETNPDHPGTHLLFLKDYLANLDKYYPSPDGSKYRFAAARLSGVDVDEKKLWSVMYQYDGTPFPPTKQEFLHWIEGQVDIDSGMLNSFCAQMVANTYQKMGWLKLDHPANHYNPGSYAKTREINSEMKDGACLERPQYFKL
ncbi:MAG: hypothetical protein KZQ94_13470 [Candidatus Thiodiazotropha sp. (ex Troendleina suluensis)]|nr:hypothetical protein [Candidatus Thiodiazotropha sp. (ex Troendleina suluensis)]